MLYFNHTKSPMNALSEGQFQDIPLSISECAKIFGLSEKTVRRALKDGEIPHILVKSRYRIMFADLLQWSHSRPRLKTSRDERGIGHYVAKWQLPRTPEGKQPKPPKNKDQLNFFDSPRSQTSLF